MSTAPITVVQPSTDPGTLPTYPVAAPVAPATPQPSALSSVPTWAWVVGGVALLGIIGAIIWAVSQQSSSGAKPASKPNPLAVGEGTRRRFRRLKRRKTRRA